MRQLDDLDAEILTYWAAEHRKAERLPGRAFVEAASQAALTQLRCYTTASDLLQWHDLRSAAGLALIRSLLPDVTATTLWQVWCAALHLRWLELAEDLHRDDGDERRLDDV